jgi:DNA repair protein RadD
MSLWDHQLRGMQELRAAYADGNSSVLCVAPCGSGKTRFATELCWSSIELGFRPLFVVHNGELMQQSIDAFRERGIDTGVIWSGHEMDLTRPMQIGTIQTLMRRELPSFDFLILDEAHLHMTRSARLLIERVKPGSILGLSASPTLLGGRSLGDLYTALRQLAQPSELIAKGILLEPTVYAPSHPDVLGVPTLGGDFDASKLIEVCNTTKLVGDITESYGRLEHKPQAILFAVDRSHSISCRDRLRGAGLRAEHIDGTTPKAERDALLDRFKRGDIDVLCNVNILSTGFNYPPLECVIIARPTQSEALHIQMCSRAFRSWHGKRKPVILDHSGNTVVRHGFAHADRDWSDALKPSKRKKTSLPSLRTCLHCYAVFEPSGRACPVCGVEPAAEPSVVKQVSGTLEIVTKAPTPDEKRKQFAKLCDLAITGKLTRYWVMGEFKKQFGHPPMVKETAWPGKLARVPSIERERINRVCMERGLSEHRRQEMLKKAGLSDTGPVEFESPVMRPKAIVVRR